LVEISIDDVAVEDGNRATTKKLQFNPVKAEAGTGTGTDNTANAGTSTSTGTGAAGQEGEVQNVR
jgi:hypothetical protein